MKLNPKSALTLGLLAFAAFASAPPAGADPTERRREPLWSISGTLASMPEGKFRVSDIDITVGVNQKTLATTRTDKKGNFVFQGLPYSGPASSTNDYWIQWGYGSESSQNIRPSPGANNLVLQKVSSR